MLEPEQVWRTLQFRCSFSLLTRVRTLAVPPQIGVIALSKAQARLIRRLLVRAVSYLSTVTTVSRFLCLSSFRMNEKHQTNGTGFRMSLGAQPLSQTKRLGIGENLLMCQPLMPFRCVQGVMWCHCVPSREIDLHLCAAQGAERDVVIVCCSRTKNASAFTDSRTRLNVALTRARYHLIIVGHLRVLNKSPMWKQVVEYAAATRVRCWPLYCHHYCHSVVPLLCMLFLLLSLASISST